MDDLNSIIEQKIAWELGSLKLQVLILEAEKLQLMTENTQLKAQLDGDRGSTQSAA